MGVCSSGVQEHYLRYSVARHASIENIQRSRKDFGWFSTIKYHKRTQRLQNSFHSQLFLPLYAIQVVDCNQRHTSESAATKIKHTLTKTEHH